MNDLHHNNAKICNEVKTGASVNDSSPLKRNTPIKALGGARFALAMAVALIADGSQFLIPPLWWLADGLALVALLFIIGPRIPIFITLFVEVIPGLELFPTWSLVVISIVATQIVNKPKKV